MIILAASTLAGCAQPAAPVAPHASPPSSPSLLGATPTRLQAWIGPPALRRIDGPVQVWLYDTRFCRLDVVFYPDAAGQPHVTVAMPMPSAMPMPGAMPMPSGVSSASCLANLEQHRAS